MKTHSTASTALLAAVALLSVTTTQAFQVPATPNNAYARTTVTCSALSVPCQPQQQRIRTPEPTTIDARTLYEILGARKSATKKELKLKYVSLAKQTHPDAVRATDRVHDFSQVAQAWSVLSDPKQRRSYDRGLQAAEVTQLICLGIDQFVRSAVGAFELGASLLALSRTVSNNSQR